MTRAWLLAVAVGVLLVPAACALLRPVRPPPCRTLTVDEGLRPC